MRDFSTLDLETDPFKFGRMPRAFAGCFYNGKINSLYWGENSARETVKAAIEYGRKVNGLLVYAHNGGKFDFHFLLQFILEFFPSEELEIMTIGARIVKIKCPYVEFRDSFSIIPKPLRSFGAKKEIDINKLESDVRESHKEEICAYLRQDCIGLYDALEQFFDEYGCDITLASCTFKVLKKQFKIKPIKTGEHYDEQFRKFYFAGRVQFFALGKSGNIDGAKRFSICDINSAFPCAMLLPHWFGGEYMRGDTIPTRYAEQSFYHVTATSAGCLPIREENGGVSFPHRTGEFFATGWELLTGLELGLITNLKIHTVYTPKVLQDFSEYVNHFYELKKTAETPAERDFAKLFLNSLYGKFALNPREFRDVKITPWGTIPEPKIINPGKKTEKAIPFELSYDDLERGLSFWQIPSHNEDDEKPLSFYNVSTAASITGCVRAFLQRSLSACKGVLYCDTDSIIAEDVSALEMSPDKLGAWKLEKQCDAIWIGGKKLYAAHDHRGANRSNYNNDKEKEWKTASKGVRLKVEDLLAVCEGEERKFSFDAPSYSVFSAPHFTTRTVRRDDKRKKRNSKNEK